MKYTWAHEAIAAAVRRKFPHLIVTSWRPAAGDPDDWMLNITGGSKAERAAALDYAHRYAAGWAHKPAEPPLP